MTFDSQPLKHYVCQVQRG